MVDGQREGTVYLQAVTEPFAARVVRYGAVGLLVGMASLMLAVLATAQRTLKRANDELSRRATATVLEYRARGAVPVVIRSDALADAIVTYARTAEIDLIVMGTHGRGGLSHLLKGSIAERVVRKAPCMVLTGHEPMAKAA